MEGATDIVVGSFIMKNKNEEQFNLTMHYINHNEPLIYSTSVDTYTRKVYITDDNKNREIIASFEIKINSSSGGIVNSCDFLGNVPEMSINVDEQYNGLGLTKIMIKLLIDKIYKECPRIEPSQILLYIDTDASVGFWTRIGMTPNRTYERHRNSIGKGYEANITLQTLYKYSITPSSRGGSLSRMVNSSMGIARGKLKKHRKTKHRKTKHRKTKHRKTK